MTMQSQVKRSIAAAIERGTVDPELHAGAIELAKSLASKIDQDATLRRAIIKAAKSGEKITMPSLDNVSAPALLKVLERLNLTPSTDVEGAQQQPRGDDGKTNKLASLVARRSA